MTGSLTSIEFYTGPFAAEYNDFVEIGILPDPTTLFSLCRPFLTASQPQRLLDVGIGTGLSSLPFHDYNPALQIAGVDGSAVMLDQCRRQLPHAELRPINLETGSLPYPNNTFDITISQGTLYFLKNATDMIADMIRVTHPAGLIAFNIEASPNDQMHSRENDATWQVNNKKTVLTYQHSLSDILATVASHGAEVIRHNQRVAMEKMDGSPIRFTDILVRKL